MASKAEIFSRTGDACFENGRKLLEDAKLLFEWDRFSTALALSILAQEEFAKAFLLQLVVEDALPWLPEIQQSMAQHRCKHLLAIVMEWLPPFGETPFMQKIRRDRDRHEQWMAWSKRHRERHEQWMASHEQWMAWSKRCSERYRQGNRPDPNDPEPLYSPHPDDPNDPEPGPDEEAFYFPDDVAAALNIYRYEQIERLRSGHPLVDDDWATGKARKIAQGSLDRKKQSGFYVDVTKTGEVGLHPGFITREDASEAIERAARFCESPIRVSDEYKKLKEVLSIIFAALKDTSEER
jgi:AbiV family abortive infection protein